MCPEVEPIAAPSTDAGVRLIRLAMTRYVNRIVQTHQQGLRRVVGKKNRGEVQVAHPGPFERPGQRGAPGNLLCRLVLVLAALHGVELRRRIIRQRLLIAESAGPGDQRRDRAPMIGGRHIHVHDVGGIEGENLLHLEAVVGVGKGKRGRSIQRARGRGHIQRLRQLVAQIRVIGPKRERIPEPWPRPWG